MAYQPVLKAEEVTAFPAHLQVHDPRLGLLWPKPRSASSTRSRASAASACCRDLHSTSASSA
jgi:hypothetical protein